MVLANWDISGRPREDSPERNYYYLQSATQTRISLVKGERYIRSVWMAETTCYQNSVLLIYNILHLFKSISRNFRMYFLSMLRKKSFFYPPIKWKINNIKYNFNCKCIFFDGKQLKQQRKRTVRNNWLRSGTFKLSWYDFLSSCRHRFSAFWLRSKCSICSYQLNIWYESHVFSSILNWFL